MASLAIEEGNLTQEIQFKDLLNKLDILPKIPFSISTNGLRNMEGCLNGQEDGVLKLIDMAVKVSKSIRPLTQLMPYLKIALSATDLVTASTESKKHRAYFKAGTAFLAAGIGAIAASVWGMGGGVFPVALGAASTAITIRDGIDWGADFWENGNKLETVKKELVKGATKITTTIQTAIQSLSHALQSLFGFNSTR
jgi:uncharacterized phage infection (PIP) family protein YhgE